MWSSLGGPVIQHKPLVFGVASLDSIAFARYTAKGADSEMAAVAALIGAADALSKVCHFAVILFFSCSSTHEYLAQ